MARNFRVTDEEEQELLKKAQEISVKLVSKNQDVMPWNKLLHKIIELGLPRIEVREDGQVVFKPEKQSTAKTEGC